MPKGSHRLEEYRAKRTAGSTPEPFGGEGAPRPRLFVVQKHAARRLHFDFRLEWGGALWSWAIPQGPSLDPAVKRMAVHVEDHPVEYADFEGIIPDGNYGAGEVIVWDKGQWVPIEDPEEGLAKGKLLFDLRGYKLKGRWTLVRTKAKSSKEASRDWLLIKKADAYSAPEGDKPFGQESIHSGLTVEEIRDGGARLGTIRGELARLGAPRRAVNAREAPLMLAETRENAFSSKGWIFELKYDGFRLLAARQEGRAQLVFRRGADATGTFPEIARAIGALPSRSFVVDGEVVVLDEQGRPSFQRLQKRFQLRRAADIEKAAVELTATLFVFDLLAFEEFDLRPLPLLERKALLQQFLPRTGPLRYVDHIEEQGEAFYDAVSKMRLEGVMAKKADGPYRTGRSAEWLKIRVDRVGDFAVVGFSMPKGSQRSGFGALHLGAYDQGRLVYMGRVGTGFDAKQLKDIRVALDRSRRPDPPCEGPVPRGRDHVWVEPHMVCEVRYKEWTEEGLLRQPAFLRLRDDKGVEECLRDDRVHGSPEEATPAEAPPPEPESAARTVQFTNLKKVFWPDEGYTKGDLIEFYRKIAPWLLIYLEDRPVVMTRYPDGIAGKNFFQKDAPEWAPGWVRTERMWSDNASREIDYFICDDEASLLYVINMGCIPLHIWSSRVKTLSTPDWSILDLDPKGAPFSDVVTVALAIRALCEEMEIESFVKTSGSTGLHVLVPLGRQCTYEQSKNLGELMSKVIELELPAIATTTRVISARGGRVYLDFLQNGHGKLLVSPYSVRPLPGAPVSTPLRWEEVNGTLDIRAFTIQNVPARFEAMGQDPVARVITTEPDLETALTKLGERLRRAMR